jgi:segregation and condensation protein B
MEKLGVILEAALLAANQTLSIERMRSLFEPQAKPSSEEICAALKVLAASYTDRGIELIEVASGFRLQVKSAYSQWIARLWEEKPAKYTRSLLETLALIAYKQPITRAEIEAIRGVAVNSAVIRTLQEREWIKVIGYKDAPGKPGLYGTTQQFLDYFNIKSLDALPSIPVLTNNMELAIPQDEPAANSLATTNKILLLET